MNVFAHQGDIGDIVAALPTIRALGGGEIVIGFRAGPNRGRESMEGKRFEIIRPLLEAQPYVTRVRWSRDFAGMTHDLSDFRHDHILGESLLDWQARHLNVRASTDPWLSNITPRAGLESRIVVARTERYQNWQFPWREIVKTHRERILFIGLPAEHKAFSKLVGPVEYLPTGDMLEVAEVIAGSQLLIANQTAACWVGLGLGHPLIQEQSPVTRDSMIPRDNAQYCLYDAMPKIPAPPGKSNTISIAQKPTAVHNNRTMLAVLPFHQGDRDQAKALAEHIRDLGGVEDHQCLLIFPQGTSADGILEPLQEAFQQVHIHSYPATLSGWPQGANEAFAQAASRIALDPGFPECFVWIEPDCVFTTSRWLSTLATAWKNGGMPILGVTTDTVALDSRQKVGRHVVGVAVYPKDFARWCPLVRSVVNMSSESRRAGAVPMAFDPYFGPYTVPKTCETRLIQHFWCSGEFEKIGGTIVARKVSHEGAENVVSSEAVLLHGCKDGSLLALFGGKPPATKPARATTAAAAPAPISPQRDPVEAEQPTPTAPKKSGKPAPQEAVAFIQLHGVTQVPVPKRGKPMPLVPIELWNMGEDGRPVPPFLPGQIEYRRYNELMIGALDPKGGFKKIRDYAKANLKINTLRMNREKIAEACVLAERAAGKQEWVQKCAAPWFKNAETEVTPTPPEPPAPVAESTPSGLPTYSADQPTAAGDISPAMRAKMIQLRKARGLPVGV